MVFVKESEITLSTRFGKSQVQLMLGDITRLPMEEKVDFIIASAFPDQYTGVKGTVIYSLSKKLHIDVNKLAQKKEIDFRAQFSCWVSKSLPPDKPYRQLLCFEVNQDQTIIDNVSMVFRAARPIFNSKERTVITPVLATGVQGVETDQMLKVMVDTACNWMKAGLPLKCLKIVLFEKKKVDRARRRYETSIYLFNNLKRKWESEEIKTTITACTDVTFCYHSNNKEKVTELCKILKKEEKSLTIHQDGFEMKKDQAWQDEVFDILANSTRIIIVLTPLFVTDNWCLDQFNLAVSCSLLKNTDMVIPFYIEKVIDIPSYINLIQYRDCRGTDQESPETRMLRACKNVIDTVHATRNDMENKPVPVYDVFISYCHRTASLAKFAFEFLKTKYPYIEVFFDKCELREGNNWQQTVYEAVDKTRCVVAMLSDEYIKSDVCEEEYNISLARVLAQDNILLVPVCLRELSTIRESYKKTTVVSVCSREDVEQLIEKIIPTVLNLKDLTERKARDTENIRRILKEQRKKYFEKFFRIDSKTKKVRRRNAEYRKGDIPNMEARISLSYASDGMKYAAVLTDMLHRQAKNITCDYSQSYDQVEVRKQIVNADMVVMFLSNEFLQSQHHMEVLHIALCRQRKIKHSTVIYLVEVSPITQGFYYPSILPFHVSLDDSFWKRFEFGEKCKKVVTNEVEGEYRFSFATYTALRMMKLDVLRLLLQRGKGSDIPTLLVNVLRVDKLNQEQEDKEESTKEVSVSVSSYVAPEAIRENDETVATSERGNENVPENQTIGWKWFKSTVCKIS